MSLFEQIGDKSGAARVQLALAELLIDRGANLQAAAIASRAGEEFAQEKAVRYEALANGVLARAFLAQGQLADAQQTIERAKHIAELSRSPSGIICGSDHGSGAGRAG